MTKQAIGMIDSGVGGLTVMKEAIKQLPNESFYYVGDTARCPYGPRPLEEVKRFTWQMAHFLMNKNIKMLVIACNTATAAALDELQEQLPIPVIGVIQSGSRAAITSTKTNRVGIIGTEGTVKSEVYPRSIEEENGKVDVFSLACPPFVPLVEENEYTSEKAAKIVEETLLPLKEKELDTLVLGCTHYPILRPLIQQAIGDKVRLIDSGVETVQEVNKLLKEKELESRSTQDSPERKFYTTGTAENFKTVAEQWLGMSDLTINHIDLG